MLKHRRIIQESARRIAAAANRVAADYAPDGVEQRSDFTGIMLSRIRQSMDGFKTRGIRWTAKTHSIPAKNAIDGGADFLGLLEFDLPESRIKKGFLGRVIHLERGQSFAAGDWESVFDQSRAMCAVTTESFVFVCAQSGIIVVLALAIAAATAPVNPHAAYSRTLVRFYQDHFECFVGDSRLSSMDGAVIQQVKARHALHLSATQVEDATGVQMNLGAGF